MQAFQVDFGVFLGHHQINRLFLVAQEQIFGVAARNLASQGLTLLDGKQRRMANGGVADA